MATLPAERAGGAGRARPLAKTLPAEFYARPVVEVARDLIGCRVSHGQAAGVIVEAEAYHEREPACHAFVGLTPRTRTLFGESGKAYVYRSYGVHALLNAVCEPQGIGAAVLIRALAPTSGLELMRARRAASAARLASGAGPVRDADLCSGPGKLTQALGIWLDANDTSLSSGPVRVGPPEGPWLAPEIVVGTRVGINQATELRWRFCAAGNGHVSRPRP
jgi:DNA-3-methyladenine glycosylase